MNILMCGVRIFIAARNCHCGFVLGIRGAQQRLGSRTAFRVGLICTPDSKDKWLGGSRAIVMALCLTCGNKVSIFKNLLLFRRTHECSSCETRARVRSRSVLFSSVLNAIIVSLIGLTAGVTGDYARWIPVLFIWFVIFLLLYSATAELEERRK